MHTDYLQNLRYKLERRVSRLRSTGWEQYISVLRQFWRFFDQQTVLIAVAEELKFAFPQATEAAKKVFAGTILDADDEREDAALVLAVLRRMASERDPRAFLDKIVPQQSSSRFNDYLEAVNARYLSPFYEYVDERL